MEGEGEQEEDLNYSTASGRDECGMVIFGSVRTPHNG